MEKKCSKVINVIKCLAGMEWEADVTSLKNLYEAPNRSRLDHGSIVCGSAAKSVLMELDVIPARLWVCL